VYKNISCTLAITTRIFFLLQEQYTTVFFLSLNVSESVAHLFFFQVKSFNAEDMKEDYDTGKDGISMVTFKVDFDQAEKLEDALKANCSRELKFYKQ